MRNILDEKVLVLNKTFFPLRIVNVRYALEVLLNEEQKGKAVIMDEHYSSYTMEEWTQAKITHLDKAVRTTTKLYIAPDVIRLLGHDQILNRGISLTRQNLFLRDDFTCQYCGSSKDLTWDHVIPRTRYAEFGLKKHQVSSWTNVVTCCSPCNGKKANKTPEEAGMVLANKPIRPKSLFFRAQARPEWKNYLKETG